jgi:peptide/nickel transport system permease protein
MGRFGFVLRRLMETVPLLLAILFAVFLLLKVSPGDPARMVAGIRASEEQVEEIREQMGLNESVPVQFGRYLKRLAGGDLGDSNKSGVPVTTIIADRLPVTLWLLVTGSILAVAIAVALSVAAARRPDGIVDQVVRAFSLFALTMPAFWLGILLLVIIAIPTGWFPVGGWADDFTGRLQAIALPAVTLALAIAPILIRSLRSSMIGVLQSEYVRAARSVGVRGLRLTRRFVLRNAVVPSVALLAVQIGYMLFGAVIVETTFALPGLGQAMVEGASNRDFNVVQGLTLVFSLGVVGVNLLGDVVLTALDPRVELR